MKKLIASLVCLAAMSVTAVHAQKRDKENNKGPDQRPTETTRSPVEVSKPDNSQRGDTLANTGNKPIPVSQPVGTKPDNKPAPDVKPKPNTGRIPVGNKPQPESETKPNQGRIPVGNKPEPAPEGNKPTSTQTGRIPVETKPVPTTRPEAGTGKSDTKAGNANHSKVPPGHYPPAGMVRVWNPQLPPGHQAPPQTPESLSRTVIPPGSFVVDNSNGQLGKGKGKDKGKDKGKGKGKNK